METAPTLWVIKLAKEAVYELFLHHRDELQRSWGTNLDQEEAVAYLVCDLVGLEILPREARTIGKATVKAVYEPKRGAKDKDALIKGAAAARRTRARQAAEKNSERAAGLDARLKEIDADRDADRAALWGTTPNVGLPDRRSKIVECKPRAQPKPPDEVQLAEQALAAAEAAQVAADGATREARRARARLRAPVFSSEREEWQYWDGIVDFSALELVEPCEKERRWALRRAICEADAALRRAEIESDCAAREVKFCRWEVESAREQRAAEQAYAAQQAEAAKARAARQAEVAKAVEEARANIEACEARLEETRARNAREREMCTEFDKKHRTMQYELARSQWAYERTSCVQQHSAKVWGAGWQTDDRPAPKVFSLVGKSVSDVRGMSGEVSQEVTGTEERVALNQFQQMPLA